MLIRHRSDKYGELTDSELSEREEQRHAEFTFLGPLATTEYRSGDSYSLAAFSADMDRRHALARAIRDGREECCGEWQGDGYAGRCSKLGIVRWFREIGRDREGPRFAICDGCPVAWKMQNIGHWLAEIVDSIDSICEGDEDVWTGYGIGE